MLRLSQHNKDERQCCLYRTQDRTARSSQRAVFRCMTAVGRPHLGGTGTYGGVDSYWFGRRVGFAKRITEQVMNVQRELHFKGHKWSIEAKVEH